MKKQFHHLPVSALLSLVMLAIFALCILGVLLAGANVYRDLTLRAEENHSIRTAQQYLATRLHQAEDLYTEDFHGIPALVFPEEVDGKTYLTRIYCYDGWLRELFSPTASDFSPEDGEKLLEIQSLSIIIEDAVVILTVTMSDGHSAQILGSTREAAYEA